MESLEDMCAIRVEVLANAEGAKPQDLTGRMPHVQEYAGQLDDYEEDLDGYANWRESRRVVRVYLCRVCRRDENLAKRKCNSQPAKR